MGANDVWHLFCTEALYTHDFFSVSARAYFSVCMRLYIGHSNCTPIEAGPHISIFFFFLRTTFKATVKLDSVDASSCIWLDLVLRSTEPSSWAKTL